MSVLEYMRVGLCGVVFQSAILPFYIYPGGKSDTRFWHHVTLECINLVCDLPHKL